MENPEELIERLRISIDKQQEETEEKHEQEINALEDELEETIRTKTLEDEMKLKLLKRIQNQCTLTQIEVLHQFAIDYFPTFNPHI